MYHPWTSYVIVPLFALANVGIPISGDSLARAATSPITLGILVGYVAGKPLGIVGTSWLVSRLSGGAAAPARRLGSGCRRGQCRGDRVHGSAA